MTVAKNNPYDLLGNDPDFLAAAVYTDKKRFVLNGEAVEDQHWPVWTMLHTVKAWHIEDKVLVIILGGEGENGEPENHSGTGAENSANPV